MVCVFLLSMKQTGSQKNRQVPSGCDGNSSWRSGWGVWGSAPRSEGTWSWWWQLRRSTHEWRWETLPEPAALSEPADPWQTDKETGKQTGCQRSVSPNFTRSLISVCVLKFTSPWRCSPVAVPGWCWRCLTHWPYWSDRWWTSSEPPSSSSDRPGCTGGEALVTLT